MNIAFKKTYNWPMCKTHMLVFPALVVMLLSSSCTSNTDQEVSADATRKSSESQPFEVTRVQFESSDMKLGRLELSEFHKVVKAKGMIDVPPSNRAEVSSYFGGTVKEVNLLPGEHIAKGQVLFLLENPDYVQIQQDYLEAKGQLTYLQSDYERQKNLAKDSVTSQKQYLKAEADYNVTSVTVESLRKKLGLMNIDADALTLQNIQTTITVKSPISGYITEVIIAQGTFLSPAQPAVKIVNTDHLHLELNVFERDLYAVGVGQKVSFRIQESNGGEYDASVYLVNRVIDPERRTIGIHAHIANDKLVERLNPGMYVEADIYSSSVKRLSLPKDALVEIDGAFYALSLQSTSDAAYTFKKSEIKTGLSNSNQIEILNSADFDENAQFLINGAFNLITE